VTGVPDDPSEQPTRMAKYGPDGSLQQGLDDEPDRADEAADSAEPDFAPAPWYRNRVLLVLWALALALLLTLIIYGLVELSRGEGGGPVTTTPSTSHTQSSSTSPTTTPSSSSEAPPPETPEQTPQEAPPQNTNSPAPSQPPQHRHHFHLPPLPHGFF
jgi:hypothetical protein